MLIDTLLIFVITALALLNTAAAAEQNVTVGDDLLQISLVADERGLREAAYRVGDTALADLSGRPCSLVVDGKPVSLPTGALKCTESKPNTASFAGENDALSWKLRYEVVGPGLITKSLQLTPNKAIRLDRVALWDATSGNDPAISRTNQSDIAAFYRRNDRGLFASLDFPYSNIMAESGSCQVTYPPYVALKSGETYTRHTLTIGATKLTGRMRYGFDDGEVDAMDTYIQKRYKPRFEKPMFTTASIKNRHTQVAAGTIFYTMQEHPTLTFNLDVLKREIALMPKLGIEYYQVFPGVFDWVPDDPKPETVHEIVDFANARKVKIGDYSGTNTLFCSHYNEYGNTLDKPNWLMAGAEGQLTGPFCFGNPEFVDYYSATVADNCKKYGFRMHCLDFLAISPCYATNHGHPAGKDSVYHQVWGLVRFAEAVNAVSPDMMLWPNSGCWSDFLPKIGWYCPNLYLTDPYLGEPWQGLNMTRLLDDVRREQMVSLHYKTFTPYRFFTNCQYFLCQNSPVPDIREFEFGALSTIAVTPNLCLAEVRPWIDDLKAADQQKVFSFYTKWTNFLTENFDLWKKTYSAGENPGNGSIEIYGHAKGGHGFVFLVNANYWNRTVEVPLDASLGLDGDGKCEIAELYPTERLRLTSQGPFASYGSKIAIDVPARQVIVLEVRPAPAQIDAARLYGLPGTIQKTNSGYHVETTGPQGRTERFAVLQPQGGAPIASAEVNPDVPKQPKRTWSPTPITILETSNRGTLLDVTFRREPVPTELREWKVKPGTPADEAALSQGIADGSTLSFPLFVDAQGMELPMWDETANKLALGPLANFCGAYIENAFCEQQKTVIELTTKPATADQEVTLASGVTPTKLRALPDQAKSSDKGWWLQTTFNLPFLYTLGMEPAHDDHTLLVLPTIRRDQVKQMRAWINGAEIEIRAYHYPRNRHFACNYADLVGSSAHHGDNTLVIYYESN